jgi:DNA polymerase-3 subunit epsilon
MGNFIAIDFETANSNRKSACSIGITRVENNQVVETQQMYIKPPSEFGKFAPFNSAIHGIRSKDVINSPAFPEIWAKIEKLNLVKRNPFVCHYSKFDFGILRDLFFYYKITFAPIRFYDTLIIAQNIWPKLVNHKLITLSQTFDIPLQHHNASSDAEACAEIALLQLKHIGKSTLEDAASECGLKLGVLDSQGIKTMSYLAKYDFLPENDANTVKSLQAENLMSQTIQDIGGSLNNHELVFTGELSSMSRKTATEIALKNGAMVSSFVSKKTSYLVVGMSAFEDYQEGKKTSKLLHAERLLKNGQSISLIDEKEFIRLTTD